MSPPRHDSAQGRPEPLADVLARVQAELEEIARRIDRNQATIARSAWHAAAADSACLEALQDADLSAQRIAGIAGFLRALAAAAHPQWRIDTAPATNTITLASLRHKIAAKPRNSQNKTKDGDKNETVNSHKTRNHSKAGNVDLF